MRTQNIVLPNAWAPRPYQVPVLKYFGNGGKRASTWWHRRAGKDSCAINFTAGTAHQRVGTYWHVLPTLKQARKAVWEGIDKQGRRIIDQAIPKALRDKTRDDEMTIHLKCGSIWRLVGGDSYDGLVGSNPVGAVFSEWALTDPRAWDYIRPIMAENDGWAWFITTPRGKNHAYTMHEMAAKNPEWFHETLTVEQTGAIPLSAVDAERRAGMPEARIRQEFYCDAMVGNVGSIYRDAVEDLIRNKGVGDVPWNPEFPVETWWDLGLRDNTAILFVQRMPNGKIHVIDFMTDRGKLMPHYYNELRKKPYFYSRHVGPHDLDRANLATGLTLADSGLAYGIHFETAPKLSLEDGINAVRIRLPMMRFDAVKCDYLLRALAEYEYEYDEDEDILSTKPAHTWASHPADALRTGIVTPDNWGLIPSWFHEMPARTPNLIGHNGGPPLTTPAHAMFGFESYDPLGAYRQ